MNFVERYSTQWYYQRWPIFYNKECYRIMEEHSKKSKHFSVSEGLAKSKNSESV